MTKCLATLNLTPKQAHKMLDMLQATEGRYSESEQSELSWLKTQTKSVTCSPWNVLSDGASALVGELASVSRNRCGPSYYRIALKKLLDVWF
jgi:hypothetical protein